MYAKTPAMCKPLGRQVKNFVPQRWEQVAPEVAYRGCLAKFQQHENLQKVLLDTGNKTLGEATCDCMWGVGLSLSARGILDKGQWVGSNIMTNALMRVRDTLRSKASFSESGDENSDNDSVFRTLVW